MENREELETFLKLLKVRSIHPHLEELCFLLFTPEERKNIHARLQIIKALLAKDLTQREIAELFQVSISQITRGSNALKQTTPDLLKLLTLFLNE